MSDQTTQPPASARLLRIQEVADETGLTARAIRYYEELGLLEPAGRSEGAYRLYDADDVERLRFIRGLRDDAGFSLAEVGQMLEDERARARNRAVFTASRDPAERRALLLDALARVDRQVASLTRKLDRLGAMMAEAERRRTHLDAHLAELEAEAPNAPPDGSADSAPPGGGRPPGLGPADRVAPAVEPTQ